jgi:hypothetical protein
MFISKALIMDDEENNFKNVNDANGQNKTWEEIGQKRINYVKLGQLLTELGFLPMNLTPDSVERELLFDLWNMLKGEDFNGISIDNLKKILLII